MEKFRQPVEILKNYHDALSNDAVTAEEIRGLIASSPKALQQSDNIGQLPLHVACGGNERAIVASLEVIQLLL